MNRYKFNIEDMVLCIALMLALVLTGWSVVHMVNKVDSVDQCVLVFNENGHGSGAIVGDRMVLTAAHVAKQSDLKVKTNDGRVFSVVSSVQDKDSDLAILYVNESFHIPAMRIWRSGLDIGTPIHVIGTPVDKVFQNVVLPGVVVGLNRSFEDQPDWNDAVILDAHGAPGCSGAPVLDSNGRIRAVLVGGVNIPLCIAIPIHNLDIEF